MSVLLGNGDGSLQGPRTYGTGAFSATVAVGDFNQDGIADLAVGNNGSNAGPVDASVSVLLGNGDGTFQSAQNYAAGSAADAIAVGDFSGDGFPDLAVGTGYGVTVLLNAADWNAAGTPPPASRHQPVDLLFAELAVPGPAAVLTFPALGSETQPGRMDRSWVAPETRALARRGGSPIPLVRRRAWDNTLDGWEDPFWEGVLH